MPKIERKKKKLNESSFSLNGCSFTNQFFIELKFPEKMSKLFEVDTYSLSYKLWVEDIYLGFKK